MDRILEAARFADDGNGAVAQGDELAQAARFVPRRHEEHVGSGVDLVGQGFVEGDVRRYLGRMAAGQFAEGFFIAGIARPDQDQLDVVVDEFIHDARDQVQALVFDEARDHGDHGDAPLDAQAQFGPQGIFIFPLASPGVGDGILALDIRVRFRIVDVDVQAVDDARHLFPIAADIAIQAFAKVRIGDFLGIRRTDRRDVVGVDHARLHVVHAAVTFQAAVVEEFLRQANDVAHDRRRIDALVFQVVNGIDDFDSLVEIIVPEIFFEEDAHEARMPVVAVDDVRLEADLGQHGQDGAAEIGEAFVVIAVAVEDVALEIPFVVDEIDGHAVLLDFFDTVVELAPDQVHDACRHFFHLLLRFFSDAAVFRNDQADVHALLG